MNTEIEAISLRDFIAQQGFVQLATNKVRYNTNKYPFLTFIDANNKATNVYFSKNEAENILNMERLEGSYIKKLNVVMTTNAEGEKRFKLTTGNSERIDLDDLLS